MRLERAALELFAEQGYADTTVPQITERAGLTTRTFFRHFADKPEVLFFREREFPTVVTAVLADAPASLHPWALVMFGLEAVTASRFDQWRGDLLVRRLILRDDVRLRERELLKSAVLADAIESALLDHNVDPATAALLAPMAVVLFNSALSDWLDANVDSKADARLDAGADSSPDTDADSDSDSSPDTVADSRPDSSPDTDADSSSSSSSSTTLLEVLRANHDRMRALIASPGDS
ncbi:TetR family transcriptional regulator [Glaciihabitans tibetensis]|uniref:TetR family transcriptional regulator n=2 Tax=Glaciihabitans tibetensis TaxID=1266600 RepID=A0A2T0VAD8_9MICO|nr:TetR family transcriptional regulator [Glaciihabitans tibetensis]